MTFVPLVPDWPAPANVRAACTTRLGGISVGPYSALNLGSRCGDEPAAVTENRQRLAEVLALPASPHWLHQVHGTRVIEAQADGPEAEADAAWTDRAGVVCVAQAADCLPVLFCDDAGTVVAAAHAGWRGLCAGVLEATVAALPVAAPRLLAWLGPAIGPDDFEVGDDVRCAFVAVDPAAAAAFRPSPRPGRWLADLFQLARQRLAHAGVARVYGGGVSTYADPDRFHSFRRDGVCGRMAALIWRMPT